MYIIFWFYKKFWIFQNFWTFSKFLNFSKFLSFQNFWIFQIFEFYKIFEFVKKFSFPKFLNFSKKFKFFEFFKIFENFKKVDYLGALSWQNATTSEVIFVIESLLQWLHLSSAMVSSSTFFCKFSKTGSMISLCPFFNFSIFQFFLKCWKILTNAKFLNFSKFFKI